MIPPRTPHLFHRFPWSCTPIRGGEPWALSNMGGSQSLTGLTQIKVWLSLGMSPSVSPLPHSQRIQSHSSSPASTLGARLNLLEISQLLVLSDCVQVSNPQASAFAWSSGAQV